ncbi:MAG: response regulator transcription factor [Acidobacteria bacterium]|nr:response regulator transcription factor [Acidobacteriota bacterium]
MSIDAGGYSSTPVLIIDDDQKLCRLISDYLKPMGYEVDVAGTGPQGLEMVKGGSYKAVILDVMLPGMDGFEVLRQIRSFSTVPVLMLTALGDESDRIVGLEIGADDYLPKTFSTRELLARLRAVTRRSQMSAEKAPETTDDRVVVNELQIEPSARRAVLGETNLNLTPLEFDLLLALAKSADRVMSRENLLDVISGRDYEVFDRSIDVHISSLRRKLGDDPKHPKFIKTLRSAGYLMIRNLPVDQ